MELSIADDLSYFKVFSSVLFLKTGSDHLRRLWLFRFKTLNDSSFTALPQSEREFHTQIVVV